MLRILINITITATAIIIALAEIRFEILAATGEAIALPITKPATASQCLLLSMVINVMELINAIKNRDSFTVPNENRGCRPPAIKVDNTIEPQPPPPTASINPPPKPNNEMFFIFSDDFFGLVLNAFERITNPRMRVYMETIGLVYRL